VAALLAVAAPGWGAMPRWMPIGPPAGPLASRLFPDPQNGERLYALTAAGLWRSQDGGNEWHSIQDGRNGLDWPPLAFAIDPVRPSRLYASVVPLDGSAAILRSDDFGDHWRAVFRSPSGSPVYPQELQADPFSPDTVYWLTDTLLFRSGDGGETWSCFNVDGECGLEISGFGFSPDHPQTMYVVSGAGRYKTSDGGRSWTLTFLTANGLTPDAIVATRGSETLYAWTRDPFDRGDVTPCFVRSDDDGATWQAVLADTQCGAPELDPASPRTVRMTVLSHGAPQLWVSHDGGDHWSVAGAVPYSGDLYLTAGKGLVLASNYVATGMGLFRAPGEQGPWRPANRGFMASEVTALLPLEQGLLAAPIQQLYTREFAGVPLLKSDGGGGSWRAVPLNNVIALGGSAGDPRHLIASAVRYEGASGLMHDRVLESLDEGATWRGVVDPQTDPPAFATLAIDSADPRKLYGGTLYGGFYRSIDGGFTWQAANSGLPIRVLCRDTGCVTNEVHTILPDPQVGRRLTLHFEKQIYGSVDGGESWAPRGPPLTGHAVVQALARDRAGNLIAVVTDSVADAAAGRLGVIYGSADGGLTWSRTGRVPAPPGGAGITVLTGFVANAAGLFAGTNSVGVLWSRDGGNVWTPLAGGLPSPAVSALFADPYDARRVYATVPRNGIYALQVP
jgi:photosystem II stability/assembly factor-like uncharacterized protein